MGQSFEDLLQVMPDIAEAVNGFEDATSRHRALDALLDAFFGRELEVPSYLDRDDADEEPQHGGASDTDRSDDRARSGWQQRLVENIPDEGDVADKPNNRDYQAMWALLVLWSRDEEASPRSIHDLIKTELGLGPEPQNHISTRLKEWTPKYVTRSKSGRTFVYEPTARALEVFEGLKDE